MCEESWMNQRCFSKGKADIAFCQANLDTVAVEERAQQCMFQRGYALVSKEQAEDTRAGYATIVRVAPLPQSCRFKSDQPTSPSSVRCDARSLDARVFFRF
jgi:hypothetical protein